MEWKQFITEMLFIGGAITPLYHLVMQLIRHERTATLQRNQIEVRVNFLEKRIDSLDDWRTENSGLRLP